MLIRQFNTLTEILKSLVDSVHRTKDAVEKQESAVRDTAQTWEKKESEIGSTIAAAIKTATDTVPQYEKCQRKKEHNLQRGLFWVALFAAVSAAAAAAGALYYAGIANGQLTEMRTTNDLTKRALGNGDESLKQTLAKMQGQIDETGKLSDQTSRLGDAANTANINAVNADRPWMGGYIQVNNFAVGKMPVITIVFSNSGKRPARITLVRYRAMLYPHFPDDPDKEYGDFDIANSTAIAVPGQPIGIPSSQAAPIDQVIFDELNQHPKDATYFVFAKCEYTDMRTGRKRWTHLCVQYSPPNLFGTGSGFNACPEYNETDNNP